MASYPWLNDFWSTYSTLVFTVGVHAMMALSIWLTLSCGLLSLANAAFMGIGAYASALLTLSWVGLFLRCCWLVAWRLRW